MDRDIGMGSLERDLDDHLSREEETEPGECVGCDELTTRWEYGSFICADCEQEGIFEIWLNPLDD